MRTVNIHEAKTHFSELVAAVERGEEIVIARRGQPVARLTTPRAGSAIGGKRVLGQWKDRISVDASFFEPRTDEELEEWNRPLEALGDPMLRKKQAG